MTWLQDVSIRRKLIAITMLTSTAALVLAGLAFMTYEIRSYRGALSREFSSIAQIAAGSLTAPLAFGDREAAAEVLNALWAEPRLVAAAVYTAEGAEFSGYVRDGVNGGLPGQPAPDGVRFGPDRMELFHPILLDGGRLGTVYVRTDLREMNQRLAQYAAIVAGVLLASLLAALFLSSILQRVISEPLLQLARTASKVSTDKDYAIRAVKPSEDEIGELVDRFNEMMEQIHARDAALQEAQDELEARVERRTEELRQEIGERKRVEQNLLNAKEAAEESNRAKSAFLANMSHELRTPLNAVIGYSEMLEEDAAAAGLDDFVPDLERIHKAGRHLLELINDVLDLSKIEAGRMEVNLSWVAVTEVLQEVITTVEPMARKNGNTLQVECADRGAFRADVLRFRQSLLNLLSNACKFTENGKVTLRVERATKSGRQWLHWHVEDTGMGIAPNEREKLFHSFSQVDSSATRRHGGTGLGLAISQRFCRLMGGDITVDSELNKGSTFTIHIPAGEGEEEKDRDATEETRRRFEDGWS